MIFFVFIIYNLTKFELILFFYIFWENSHGNNNNNIRL